VYGQLDPAARKINIGKFRSKKSQLLLVTDIAARGLDVPLLGMYGSELGLLGLIGLLGSCAARDRHCCQRTP